MQDNFFILAPAKLNVFLKILGRRKDGYHIIRSGITFINLFDKIEIKISNENSVDYIGQFKPKGDSYDHCIIKKTLNHLSLKKNIKFDIRIEKNIPTQAGLGSASTNAAALINLLEKMQLININHPKFYSFLGADVPCFLYKKNCFVTGIGDEIFYHPFPKYFFLLVKPNFHNSTEKMYSKLGFKINSFPDLTYNNNDINDDDNGNDFEKITLNENKEYVKIFNFLENLDKNIFVRMTGSGSCCYAVFEKKIYAKEAKYLFDKKFENLWSFVGENNIINN